MIRGSLNVARDRISRLLTMAARRLATDAGWAHTLHDLGAPTMGGGLLGLRERGVRLSSVVDVGACIGDWTRLCRKVFPEARVLMVEPQGRHAAALQAEQQRSGGLVTHVQALVGPPGMTQADFVVLDSGEGTGSSVLPEASDVPRHVETMAVCTLDELIARHGPAAPQMLKLDVQGFELEVLKGASAALSTAEFVLLELSLWPYNVGAPLAAEVMAWLDARGFRAYEVIDLSRRPDGVMVQVDMLFVRGDSRLLADTTTRFNA